ncbi:MAG TPA: phosphoglucosamine mutase [Blastocatellia bacterium]|nr:phosphoglucosamine mutase [Blastocatellia bacterium]HMV81722.1 phosphoglucosamine mutase [Blastocatellia bacterium]HMY74226.1 phosphoglucosamine mutase [Blastocatellia bacterium]HMZ17818.1 phosphoglucosamine mutase [Blastocatellia bacterium]HNG29680.1 phosphoglucosamine mutase [Blastocatellia bacterium]
MGKFFGTDGIRGVAGEHPLNESTIERIGYSLAKELTTRLRRVPQVLIGQDTRESGDWIEAAIARGVIAAAGQAISAGVITTPGVAYLTRILNADAGVVISASHNPYQDNGIKVFAPSGQKLDDAAEQAIEQDLEADASSFPSIADAAIETDAGLKERYLAFLREEIGAGLNLTGLKLMVDCANGASSELAPKLFAGLGAELTVINAEPNGRNINLDCGSLHPEKLQQAVLAARADAGLAFDGDADRLLMVDERGQLVDGDQVLFVMAEYLSQQRKLSGNRVVATVMSNLGLEVALAERGITLARTAVGDKNVLDELLKNGGSIGGEQSGHIIFPEISLAGDGMISALEVLRVMAETKRSLSALACGFTRYPQIVINVRVARKPPLDTVPEIKAAISELENELVGKGRLLVRYSGTENLARVMIEGQDETVIQRQAESLADLIQKNLK